RRLLSTTYYVSPSGSDTRAGTSPATAWKTVAPANRRTFHPGDKLLFQGGSTFSGPVILGRDDAGSASNPVVIGSYGTGRARISSYAAKFHAHPAPYGLAHANIYVGHVVVYGNTGYAGTNDSGNGINLGNVNGATIERCVAHDNGANNTSQEGGPVGI